VMVWAGSEAVQSIMHPNCVWTVYPLSGSEDFVTGGNDGVLRVFSRSEDRVGTEQVKQLNLEFSIEIDEATNRKRKGTYNDCALIVT